MKKSSNIGIYFLGLALGIGYILIQGSIALQRFRFLDESNLALIRGISIDSAMLFFYAVRKRGIFLLILLLASTTYLGILVCKAGIFSMGIVSGMSLGMAAMRYGVTGIWILLVLAMPQLPVILLAMFLLCRWCENVCLCICYDRQSMLDRTMKKQGILSAIGGVPQLAKLVGIIAILLFGCFLEAFVNPSLLKFFL